MFNLILLLRNCQILSACQISLFQIHFRTGAACILIRNYLFRIRILLKVSDLIHKTAHIPKIQ
jgi:hypothetical protein